MKVGILSLQGCIDPHIAMLKRLDVDAVPVLPGSGGLASVDRLILPGGESTTMLKLLRRNGGFQELQEFCATHPVWGICAGSILLAKEVVNPTQDSLGCIEVKAYRNYYGSQLDSFKTTLELPSLSTTIEVDFIRAPHLEPMSDKVKVLATYEGRPIIMQQGNKMVSACHTELGNDSALHEYFLSL